MLHYDWTENGEVSLLNTAMLKPRKLVIIGGCGHVGLPLGIVFANCGINVVLLDVSAERIATVNGGRTPFMENAAAEHRSTTSWL